VLSRLKRVAARVGELVVRARPLLADVGFRLGVLLLRALRVRFLGDHVVQPSWAWLGHLATEPDCFVKEGRLGWRPHYRGVILCPGQPANACLLDYWRRHLWVVTSPGWCRFLARFAALSSLRYSVRPYIEAMNETARFGMIQAAYAGQPAVLRLKRAHRAAGEARLREMGVPAGAWIVSVHCRESGYDKHTSWHAPRNCHIESYLPAMQAIVARGGWCVRLGDPSMTPLAPLPGVIDYAHSPLRCDWMDVFLCARSRFVLGSASGVYAVASVFGVPCAVANQALPAFMHPYGVADLLIPKLLWSEQLGRYLTFPEVARGAVGTARFAHCYELAGVEARDNTPEEISELAVELLDELEGAFQETDEDRRLQEAYRSLARTGHYSLGAPSRIGRRFLRKYRNLLELPEGPFSCPATARGCGTTACFCLQPGWMLGQKVAA
jgi:putative glycosyltransferase (TIGR04372 family)